MGVHRVSEFPYGSVNLFTVNNGALAPAARFLDVVCGACLRLYGKPWRKSAQLLGDVVCSFLRLYGEHWRFMQLLAVIYYLEVLEHCTTPFFD